MADFETFRNITINVDGANDWISEVRLSGGDVDGRKLTVTPLSNGVTFSDEDFNNLTGRLLFNPKPNTAFPGAYKTMDKDTANKRFTVVIPRAAFTGLTGTHTQMAIEFQRTTRTGDNTKEEIVCSRTFNAIIDPAVLKAGDGVQPDPLEEWHELINHGNEQIQDITDRGNKVIADMNALVDNANIEAGNVTELGPNQKPTFELVGEKWDKTMNLGLPRGAGVADVTVTERTPQEGPSATVTTRDDGDKTLNLGLPRARKIVQVTATAAAQDADPTATITDNADGDQILALGLPRGPKGDKGDPGSAGDVATSTVAGVVKPGAGLAVDSDGTLSVETGNGLTASTGGLSVGVGDGLEYDANNNIAVKTGSGLNISSEGKNLIVGLGTGLKYTDDTNGVKLDTIEWTGDNPPYVPLGHDKADNSRYGIAYDGTLKETNGALGVNATNNNSTDIAASVPIMFFSDMTDGNFSKLRLSLGNEFTNGFGSLSLNNSYVPNKYFRLVRIDFPDFSLTVSEVIFKGSNPLSPFASSASPFLGDAASILQYFTTGADYETETTKDIHFYVVNMDGTELTSGDAEGLNSAVNGLPWKLFKRAIGANSGTGAYAEIGTVNSITFREGSHLCSMNITFQPIPFANGFHNIRFEKS